MNAEKNQTVEVTTRGDLANRMGQRDTAVVLFIDPNDAPFLEDWLELSRDGLWGRFDAMVMADTCLPRASWKRVIRPRWWAPLDKATQQQLQTGPTLEAAHQVVALFPTLSTFERVVFACTYGKSRSQLTAQAYRQWAGLTGSSDAALIQRNPWWHHLLEHVLSTARP